MNVRAPDCFVSVRAWDKSLFTVPILNCTLHHPHPTKRRAEERTLIVR